MIFYFLGCEKREIDGKDFLCVHVLELSKKQVFRIFKPYKKDDFDTLALYDLFTNITDNIGFIIKTGGKISLDIKI